MCTNLEIKSFKLFQGFPPPIGVVLFRGFQFLEILSSPGPCILEPAVLDGALVWLRWRDSLIPGGRYILYEYATNMMTLQGSREWLVDSL